MTSNKKDVIDTLLSPIMDDFLSEIFITKGNDKDLEKIDLTTDEGFKKYNKLVDQLDDLVSDSPFFKCFIDDEAIESFRKFGEGIHKRANEPDTEPTVESCDDEKELCDMNCTECELDYCVHPDVNEDTEKSCKCSCCCRKEIDETVNCDGEDSFEIPSEKIKNIDIKLQIHRLTQKYIDEMIKPYLGENNNKQINDAYSALYEFACWIYNQK
jgi:hypothetical protein